MFLPVGRLVFKMCGGPQGTNYPFLTLKERDTETGLDFFVSRYYSSTVGRFTNADSIWEEVSDVPLELNIRT